MKRIVILVSVILGLNVFIYGQNLTKSKLVATWSYSGGGDYLEFLDNTVGEMFANYTENLKTKVIALICSKDDLPTALVSSVGFPLYFFQSTQSWRIPAGQVYLARSEKCATNSKKVTDQYWFVPENSPLKNDEIILAKNISHERWTIGYYENYESQKARNEFNGHIKEFIKNLLNNPKSQGFIVSRLNSQKTNRKIQIVLSELKKEKVDVNQVKIIRKKMFYDLYPELITVTVNK